MTQVKKTPIESSVEIRQKSKDLVETAASILATTSQLLERARKNLNVAKKKTHKQAMPVKRAG
jgi:hypothetical protein